MSQENHKKEHEEKHLEKLTVKELREIAAEIPHERAIHDMKKEEIVAFIKEARGIKDEKPVKKKKHVIKSKMTKPELKARIRELKVLRGQALESCATSSSTISPGAQVAARARGRAGRAPHICWPLRFVLPHDAHLRPAWMIRAGLFLYDHLARRRFLPGSSGVNLRRHPAGAPLEARYTKGFVYSDAWVDDARLVVITAMDAREHGATVLTRTAARGSQRHGELDRNARARGRRHARDRGPRRGERHRPLGGPLPRRRHAPAGRAPPAPGQGQPHRRAELSATSSPTSSRARTAASCSRSPTRATTR